MFSKRIVASLLCGILLFAGLGGQLLHSMQGCHSAGQDHTHNAHLHDHAGLCAFHHPTDDAYQSPARVPSKRCDHDCSICLLLCQSWDATTFEMDLPENEPGYFPLEQTQPQRFAVFTRFSDSRGPPTV